MKQFRNSVAGTILVTMSMFLSVGYMACNKDEQTKKPNKCANVTCKNSGTCYDGECFCRIGFEGKSCEEKVVLKYTGNWKVTETKIGSDIDTLGAKREYTIAINEIEGVSNMFEIDYFAGNPAYNNVRCRMGLNNKYEPASLMFFGIERGQVPSSDKVTIQRGFGAVNSTGTIITGQYTKLYPGSTQYQTDTLAITAERLN